MHNEPTEEVVAQYAWHPTQPYPLESLQISDRQAIAEAASRIEVEPVSDVVRRLASEFNASGWAPLLYVLLLIGVAMAAGHYFGHLRIK